MVIKNMKNANAFNCESVPLYDVAEIIMGQSPPGDTYHNYPIGLPFFQGKADFGDIYPSVRVYCSAPSRIAEKGDILISVRAPVGPTNLAATKCCIGRGLAAIRATSKLDNIYLLYYLRSIETQMVSGSRGSTFDSIGRDDIENILIPLPPLEEQRRIADLLARADRLRRLRRHALQLSNTFLQSVFLDMFGDPVTNPMGWEMFLLVDICQSPNGIKAGPFGSSLKKEVYTTSGYRVYGQEQVIGGNFDIGDYYISKELFEKQFRQYEVHPNDVLISLVGTFGKAIVVPDHIAPGIINPRLLKISPCYEVLNSVYLSKYLQLSVVQDQLTEMSHGGTMGVLNATQLKELNIMCPPIEYQNKYASVVASWEAMNARQIESSRQSEQLFQTLLHRAFAG